MFHFKEFDVSHALSSIKIGVDAVLIGAWADCTGDKILDVGTGCGIIGMMLAQRNGKARITCIDIDKNSIEEASLNFKNCRWKARLFPKLIPFEEYSENITEKFDLIISNPPYFNAGLKNPTTPREKARHEGSLSSFCLIEKGKKMINNHGRISLIIPYEMRFSLVAKACEEGLYLTRECRIKNAPNSVIKRIMLEFGKIDKGVVDRELILFEASGKPTEDYRDLCKAFYLKF